MFEIKIYCPLIAESRNYFQMKFSYPRVEAIVILNTDLNRRLERMPLVYSMIG